MLEVASYPQPPLGAGHLSVEYAPRPASVREARAEVRRRLEAWGLADVDDLVDTAELLVSELATNVVRHSASSPYRLTVFAAHGVLRCEVTAGALTEQTGRGMFLVAALARRWGCYQDGTGKTVWFELGTCGADGCGRRQS
ncbi:ATP-binding protein [Streptomyces justiciae]|uniref:ATP-binding protein n=1 Tax=Streptomyces justiciae TaxID=2780140 RepID=A0ABU3LQX4_9ACTN|nr:ATP-binding protein [Streptomyces justiciae]MDT7840952.1 ATP-binding protein [Streptomyces justiciae]